MAKINAIGDVLIERDLQLQVSSELTNRSVTLPGNHFLYDDAVTRFLHIHSFELTVGGEYQMRLSSSDDEFSAMLFRGSGDIDRESLLTALRLERAGGQEN